MVSDAETRNMKTIAIIPARGGSKRIPGKNIKPFGGRPLIAYSIDAAQQSGVFDRIIVSTDSEEIAVVAREYGAETPFMRPMELANDFTVTDAVLLHALDWLSHHGCPVRYFCCIYAIAPFIRADFIRKGFDILRSERAASAYSVTTYPHPIFRAMKLNQRGRVEMIWPENFAKRSQDLPEAFHDAAQFYWADAEKYLHNKRIFSGDAVPVFIPRDLVQDIDTPEDWNVAERMFRTARGNEIGDRKAET